MSDEDWGNDEVSLPIVAADAETFSMPMSDQTVTVSAVLETAGTKTTTAIRLDLVSMVCIGPGVVAVDVGGQQVRFDIASEGHRLMLYQAILSGMKRFAPRVEGEVLR